MGHKVVAGLSSYFLPLLVVVRRPSSLHEPIVCECLRHWTAMNPCKPLCYVKRKCRRAIFQNRGQAKLAARQRGGNHECNGSTSVYKSERKSESLECLREDGCHDRVPSTHMSKNAQMPRLSMRRTRRRAMYIYAEEELTLKLNTSSDIHFHHPHSPPLAADPREVDMHDDHLSATHSTFDPALFEELVYACVNRVPRGRVTTYGKSTANQILCFFCFAVLPYYPL